MFKRAWEDYLKTKSLLLQIYQNNILFTSMEESRLSPIFY